MGQKSLEPVGVIPVLTDLYIFTHWDELRPTLSVYVTARVAAVKEEGRVQRGSRVMTSQPLLDSRLSNFRLTLLVLVVVVIVLVTPY